VERLVSRPTIVESREWLLSDSCVTRGCYPHVDELKGRGIAIKIVPGNNISSGVFLIQLYLFADESAQFRFDPSKTTVLLANGKVITSKGLQCPGTTRTLDYLRSAPPVVTPVLVRTQICVLLFFDDPPPTATEIYTLTLNGLTQANGDVKVPDLIFRPRLIKEREPSGFFLS